MKHFIFNAWNDTDVESVLLYLIGDEHEHVIRLNAETDVEYTNNALIVTRTREWNGEIDEVTRTYVPYDNILMVKSLKIK